jgi:uncharacterized protein YecT (DUF1311 family)
VKKMKRIASAILLASVLLAAAHAQKQTERDPCEGEGAETQAAMNMCAAKKFKEADAELNRVYNQLASKVEAPYRAKLKAAEVSWLKYRDDNCDYETALYEGGTMRPMVYSFCLERMTKARAAELRQQIKELDEQ